jgi:hypothetical protein
MASAAKIFFSSLLDGFTNAGPFGSSDQDWAPVGVFEPEPAVPSIRFSRIQAHESLIVKVRDRKGQLVEVEVDRDGRLSGSSFVVPPPSEASR